MWEEQEALLSVELQPGTNTTAGSCPLPRCAIYLPSRLALLSELLGGQ